MKLLLTPKPKYLQSNNAPIGKALTEREIEILALISQGMTEITIADRLELSRHTVKNYVTSIRAKTGIYSRVLLAFYAQHNGYVTDTQIQMAIKQEKTKYSHM